MKTTLKGALAAVLLLGAAFSARAACPPPGWDEAALERLRAAKFELADPASREALLRAAVAYETGIRDHRGFSAIGRQVAPAGEHFYIYGESERLARPVYYAAQRGLHDSAYWSAWLATLAAPAPLPNWGAAFKTQAGLARKHNTQAFVQVLYVMVREGGNEALQQRLVPGLLAALKTLP